MNGGSPHAISVSPCCSFDMFWMPAPGTTLMLNELSLDLISSTKPPAWVYQPPPTCPAVQVRFFCWAVAGSAHTASASASAALIIRRMRPPSTRRVLAARAFVQSGLVDVDAKARAIEGENGAVGIRDRPADHVALQQQRTEQLTAPRHRRRRQRDLQVGRGAERRLDHAAHVTAEARRLRDAGDGHRSEDAGGLRHLQRQDRHPAE